MVSILWGLSVLSSSLFDMVELLVVDFRLVVKVLVDAVRFVVGDAGGRCVEGAGCVDFDDFGEVGVGIDVGLFAGLVAAGVFGVIDWVEYGVALGFLLLFGVVLVDFTDAAKVDVVVVWGHS